MNSTFNLTTPREALRGWFDRFNEIEVRGVRLALRNDKEIPPTFVVGIERRAVFELISGHDAAFDKFFDLVARERVREIIAKSRGAVITLNPSRQ